jgi:hypothetical protein
LSALNKGTTIPPTAISPGSPLEGARFELAIPLLGHASRREATYHLTAQFHHQYRGSLGFFQFGKPFHRADGPCGFDGLRFAALLGFLRVPVVVLKKNPSSPDKAF